MNDNKPIPKGIALYIPQADGSTLPVLPDLDDTLDIIAHIAEMATKAADLPSGSVGVKRDHGLRMWTINIEMFWTEAAFATASRHMTAIARVGPYTASGGCSSRSLVTIFSTIAAVFCQAT